ncbi:hypothetical protein WKK05_14535 [Nostoc sp. UHCC 0302]|uniref:hypothetical protein n=1 Tax=Nostoc sp. UHCC 0302 TaxID=3134896 RepID=UPI00311CA29F
MPNRTGRIAPKKATNPCPNALYVLEVFLIEGPITEEFAVLNLVVSRKIEIEGSNTL